MNRICLVLLSALVAGCSSQKSDVSVSSAPPTPPAAPTTAPAIQPGPGAPIPPPVANAAIYELSQDGKIYVFGFVDHMLAFQHAGKNQPVVIEKPNFTPKGTTVVIEGADDAMAAEILASYLKQHPEIKAK